MTQINNINRSIYQYQNFQKTYHFADLLYLLNFSKTVCGPHVEESLLISES